MLPFTEPTAYGLGKSGWVSAKFPPARSRRSTCSKAWIDESYRAQAPKKLVLSLDDKRPLSKPKAKPRPQKKPPRKRTMTYARRSAPKNACRSLAQKPRDQSDARRHGALRHPSRQGVRRLRSARMRALGKAARARPRARRARSGTTGWYEARMLASLRRRSRARHAGADGSLVPRLRQLGDLRHGVLPPLRSHAARLEEGRAVGAAARGVRASARRSRCSRASPCTTRTPATRRSCAACRSIERAAADERNFVKKARELGAALRSASATPRSTPPR